MKTNVFKNILRRGRPFTITLAFALICLIVWFLFSDLFIEAIISNSKALVLIKTYRIWVRKTFILPYKIVQLGDDGLEVEKTQITFTNAAFNHLTDRDVNIPSNYELIEPEE